MQCGFSSKFFDLLFALLWSPILRSRIDTISSALLFLTFHENHSLRDEPAVTSAMVWMFNAAFGDPPIFRGAKIL